MSQPIFFNGIQYKSKAAMPPEIRAMYESLTEDRELAELAELKAQAESPDAARPSAAEGQPRAPGAGPLPAALEAEAALGPASAVYERAGGRRWPGFGPARPSGLTDIAAAITAIKRAVYARLGPALSQAYQAGQPLSFGPVTVHQTNGLRFAGKLYPWANYWAGNFSKRDWRMISGETGEPYEQTHPFQWRGVCQPGGHAARGAGRVRPLSASAGKRAAE